MASGTEIALSILIGAKMSSSFNSSMTTAQKGIVGFAKAGLKGLTAITAAAATMSVAAVKNATEFQSQLQNVATLLDGTKDQVQQRTNEISKEILNISNSTGMATADLTDGMYQVVSAFGDSAESAKVLEIAAKSAAAGNATTTESINLLSAVTKGYGDTSAAAQQKAADLAFETVKLGQTTFPELAASIGKVIPLANTLGVSQEQLFGAFATLTGVTGNTAEVATQTKAALQGFLQPSAQMTEALKSLGYKSGQALLQAEGFQGALDLLKQSVKGNEIAFSDLFSSVEAKTAVLALAGTQSENLTAKTQAMYEATGAATDAYETQTQSLEHQIQVIKNLGTNFLTEIGMEIMPTLTEIAGDAIPILLEAFETISPALNSMLSSIAPLFGDLITDIAPVLSEIIVFIADLVSAQTPLVSSIMPMLISFAKQMLPFVVQIMQQLAPLASVIVPILLSALGQILPLLMQFMPVIVQLVAALMPIITDVISVLVPPLTNIITTLLPAFMQIIQSLIPLINLLNPIVYTLANIFGTVLTKAINAVMPIVNTLIIIFDGIISFISDIFTVELQKLLTYIKEIFGNTFEDLGNVAKTPINAVIGVINKAISGINSISIDVPDWVPGIGGNTYGFDIPQIPLLASGGIVTSPTVLMAGEGSESEAILPLSKLTNLLSVPASTNTSQIVFSPVFHLNGKSDKEDIVEVVSMSFEEFKKLMKKYELEKRRIKF